MTEVELVVTALATGAAEGLTGVSGGLRDLHAALREAVRDRLEPADAGYGGRVLDAYETDPDVWRTRLVRVLESGLRMDEEVLEAARAVLRADRRRPGPAAVGAPEEAE
ncbi:hypothetical protein [Streptomyces sp. NPDC050145]|uniref:hypothetical protein n=1 Tax=Streptomyces sp. NPDC050145 TaxID=3365602 RepID=UPI0037B5D7BE